MEYLSTIHKVGLPKEYPIHRGNIWFHICAQADITNDTVSTLSYYVHVERDEKLSQRYSNYQVALDYYNSLIQVK